MNMYFTFKSQSFVRHPLPHFKIECGEGSVIWRPGPPLRCREGLPLAHNQVPLREFPSALKGRVFRGISPSPLRAAQWQRQ